MLEVRFEPVGITCRVDARVIDATDELTAPPVPYSCRDANCGSCRVEVIEGADKLAAPEVDEIRTLRALGDGARVRLCCQLIAIGTEGRVVLRVVGASSASGSGKS
jgi:ferredoxin